MDTQIRATDPKPGSLDRYIVSTPDVLGGKPRIAGHRIAVTHVKAWRLARGLSEVEIAETYDLPISAVYAAMAYYFEHKAEIDAQDAASDALAADIEARVQSKIARRPHPTDTHDE